MAANLFFHYTGGASNSDPDLSLGGTGSSELLASVALNNLFDNIYPEETLSEDRVEYRAIDISNDGDYEARNVQFYFTETPNLESAVAAWYDSTGTQSILNETMEPSGASWTQPLVNSKMSLGNLTAGATHRIWIRRTVDQGAENINDDTAVLHVWFS